jgi:hypothetical protein
MQVLTNAFVLSLLCAQPDPDTMTLRGKIVEVSPFNEQDRIGMLLEIVTPAGKRYILSVERKSPVEKLVNGKSRPCPLGEIKAGLRVRAVCSPIVLASSPPVAGVRRLVVLMGEEAPGGAGKADD